MEAHEIAEQLDEHAAPHRHGAEERDWFRRLTGIYVGFVAMLLAIATLGGASATKEMLNANIHASDTYAFYQAKYLRQTQFQLAADRFDWLASASPGLSAEARSTAAALVKRYRQTAAHAESDPQKGNGKQELLAKAREWEAAHDHAAAQVPNFEYSEALYQIAIVLGSVAIVAASPWLLGVSSLLAAGGFLCMLNGFLLFVHLVPG
jgi:predicted phage tail protein